MSDELQRFVPVWVLLRALTDSLLAATGRRPVFRVGVPASAGRWARGDQLRRGLAGARTWI